MKTASVAAFTALAGSAVANDRTFAVLRFVENQELVRTREDPIVAHGKVGSHVHTVFGSSGFSMNATADDLVNACTNSQVKGDMSAYWAPALYYKDPDADPATAKLEAVEVMYANVYYL